MGEGNYVKVPTIGTRNYYTDEFDESKHVDNIQKGGPKLS